MTTALTRRPFLALASAALAPRPSAATDQDAPVTGEGRPGTEPFDRLMTGFVRENAVPGAALAVARDGKLVYARGFGYADADKLEAVRPETLFRIASVSKPLTAVAVLRLAEAGKLSLDDKVADLIPLEPLLIGGATPDPRWKKVTVRHCLRHTAGWDRDASFDPIGRPWEIAKAFGTQPPVSPEQIVRYLMGRPFDFDPGARFAYSNVGYLVLGRLIEAVSGRGYEAYVKKEILAPLGIRTARLGRARLQDRVQGETHYYDAAQRTGRSLYPPVGERVPIQYGAGNFEGYEAHGGWIASAVDLVKFACAFDDPARCPLLSEKSIRTMLARPEGAAGWEKDDRPKPAYYGCGWMVRPTHGKANVWHSGYIPGSESLLVRRWDGLTWAVLFNTADDPKGKSLGGKIDGLLHGAADRMT